MNMFDPGDDSMCRQNSLLEDLYMPDLEFSDHTGNGKDTSVLNGVFYGNDHQNANYQRFSRIASAQEMEDFDSFYDSAGEDFSIASDSFSNDDLAKLSPEAKAKAEDELMRELTKTEEEISTLRQVLSHKIRKQQELKRKLGITVWKEFREDMEHGIRTVQETTAFQKTTQTLKTAGEKTSEAFGIFSASVSKKFGEVKQSPAFKTIEEKVGTAYSSVKTKVSGSPSDANGEQTLVEKANGSQNPTEKH